MVIESGDKDTAPERVMDFTSELSDSERVMDFTEELSGDEAAEAREPSPIPSSTPGIEDYIKSETADHTLRIMADVFRASGSVVLSELQRQYGGRASELGWIDRDSIRVEGLPLPEVDANALCSQLVYRNVKWSYRAFSISDGDAIACAVYRTNERGAVYCGVRLNGSRVMDVFVDRDPIAYMGRMVESSIVLADLVQGDIVTVRVLAQRNASDGLISASGVIIGLGSMEDDIGAVIHEKMKSRYPKPETLSVPWVRSSAQATAGHSSDYGFLDDEDTREEDDEKEVDAYLSEASESGSETSDSDSASGPEPSSDSDSD